MVSAVAIGGYGMGKQRGRPPVGKTEPVRVPEDVYLMLMWIAEAERRTTTRVGEDLFVPPAVARYLQLLPRIKQLKGMEDERAAVDGREPRPLPALSVMRPNRAGWVPPEAIPDAEYQAITQPGQLVYMRGYHATLDSDPPPESPPSPKPRKPKK